MIEVKNLTKSYIHNGRRNYVFKNLSFKINTGESVALIGGNGAGKSTLLRIIGGMDFPDSGKVFSDKKISWPVGLKGGFQGSLSARENTKFVSMIFHGNEKEKIQEKIKMAKKTHVKVRLVPEAKPDSPFFYYVKKPAGGEKAKVKLKAKKYNPATRKHETFVEKELTEEDALVNARLARILQTSDYDHKTKEPILWTPPSDYTIRTQQDS